MIPKLVHGTDFNGLRDYLIEHRDHEVLALVDVSDIDHAADEMELTASWNRRVKSPVLHVSISAAIEDGTLSKSQWLAMVAAIEKEFNLAGHQHVVVRHRDKAYDHIHVFWCKVSLATFETPPKQLFLVKGARRKARGGYSLTPAEAKRLPADAMALRSFDSFALYRLQDLCRRLEAAWSLRRVRTHKEVAAAREAGEPRPRRQSDLRRQERTGAASLIERADTLRAALDAPDWPEARKRLQRLGVGPQPVSRKSKTGPGKLVGLCLYDVADPGNRIKASELDTPGRRYGLRQIESRHDEGALKMEQWWDDRFAATSSFFKVKAAAESPRSRCNDAFDLLREAARSDRAEKRRLRDALKKEQARELSQLQQTLMARRKAEAAELQPAQRREFYRRFSRETRFPILEALKRRHRAALAKLRVVRAPTWGEFIDRQAQSGDPDARQVQADRAASSSPATVRCNSLGQPHRTRKSPDRHFERSSPARVGTRAQSVAPIPSRTQPATKDADAPDIATQLAWLERFKDRTM